MQWKPVQIGDERIRSFFALLPARQYNNLEARWLERVTVRERYVMGYAFHEHWVIMEFIDD